MEERCVVMVVFVTILGFSGLLQQASAEECVWISRCQNMHWGGCPMDFVPVDMSNDCQGLCTAPQYLPCPPFFTRFQCCNKGKARQTDAYSSAQPKPREIYKWNQGHWNRCSGPCGEAKKWRSVRCLRYLENAPQLPTVVDDEKCLASIKPSSEEPCPRSCIGRHSQRHHGLPIWAKVLISLTTVAGIGGLAFAGFVIYKRWTDSGNHGFVYVMLEGY